MKKIFGILVLLAVLIVSCSEQRTKDIYERQLLLVFNDNLLRIDSLMQYDADSALIMLTVISTEAECSGEILSKYNANYKSLLLSEALYKTYNVQYYRNDLINATHYFDSLLKKYPGNDDITMLSARSHYMNGVGYYENDSMVDACKEYLNTLEIMENHFDEKELVGYKAKFMALTYNRLYDLFTNRFMEESALYCSKKSLAFNKIMPTSKYAIANNINKIGNKYNILGYTDSAYYYYKTALNAMPDNNNTIYRDIVSSMALLSYDTGQPSEQALADLKRVLQNTDNEDERFTRLFTMGYIYYNEKIYDTALFCLKQVFENKYDAVVKIQAADYLCKIYQQFVDTINSNKYEKYLAENTISKYDNMLEVSIIDKLFNDYLEQQKDKEQYHNSKRPIVLTISIFVIVLLLIIVISKVLSSRKLAEAYRKHKNERDSLIHNIKTTEEKVLKLKKELGIKYSNSDIRRELLLKEPVCVTIHKMVDDLNLSARDNYYKYNLSFSDDLTSDLHSAVLKHCERFDAILLEKCPTLKPNDLLLCYLLLIGLNEKQIAVLRHRTYFTIKKQTNKIKKLLKISCSLSDYVIKTI